MKGKPCAHRINGNHKSATMVHGNGSAIVRVKWARFSPPIAQWEKKNLYFPDWCIESNDWWEAEMTLSLVWAFDLDTAQCLAVIIAFQISRSEVVSWEYFLPDIVWISLKQNSQFKIKIGWKLILREAKINDPPSAMENDENTLACKILKRNRLRQILNTSHKFQQHAPMCGLLNASSPILQLRRA